MYTQLCVNQKLQGDYFTCKLLNEPTAPFSYGLNWHGPWVSNIPTQKWGDSSWVRMQASKLKLCTHNQSNQDNFWVTDTLQEPEFEPLWGQEFFLHVVQASSVIHLTSYPMGIGRSFPGGKADHSSPATAEVKKMWIYTSTPPYTFMAVLN
jgi:hypothetical protein